MDRAVGMLRRRIDGVELEVLVPVISEVVARARRDEDEVLRADLLRLAIEDGRAAAGDEGEHLVPVVVHLLADLPAGGDAHHDELSVRARVEHASEIAVGASRVLDRSVPGHRCLLFQWLL
jgi:hypothetical protein